MTRHSLTPNSENELLEQTEEEPIVGVEPRRRFSLYQQSWKLRWQQRVLSRYAKSKVSPIGGCRTRWTISTDCRHVYTGIFKEQKHESVVLIYKNPIILNHPRARLSAQCRPLDSRGSTPPNVQHVSDCAINIPAEPFIRPPSAHIGGSTESIGNNTPSLSWLADLCLVSG